MHPLIWQIRKSQLHCGMRIFLLKISCTTAFLFSQSTVPLNCVKGLLSIVNHLYIVNVCTLFQWRKQNNVKRWQHLCPWNFVFLSLILAGTGIPRCLTFQHFCAFGNQDSLAGYVCHVVTLMAVFVRPKAVFHAGVEWHQCHINKKKVLWYKPGTAK